MKIFNCKRCDKKLWTNYHKLPDSTVVCNDCYTHYLMQTLDEINDNQAYDIIYNFVEKYVKKFPPDMIRELAQLLKIKYNITIDVVTLSGILNILKSKIEKDESLKKLARFERDLIKDSSPDHLCEICNVKLPKSEFDYSMEHFGKPLCLTHQKEKRASPHALKLYDALKKRGVECELESFDSHNYIDISIKNAKLYIGIDGEHHYLDPEQLQLDLMMDEESQKKGFATKRYALREIDEKLEGIADTLTEVVRQRIKKYQKNEFFGLKEPDLETPSNDKKQDKKGTTNFHKNENTSNKP